MMTERSSPAVANRRPSALKARSPMESVWPRRVRTTRPVDTSQILTARSAEAEASHRPSRLRVSA